MNIAIFASGGGSNAEVILSTLNDYIPDSIARVKLVLTNNSNAGVLAIANKYAVQAEIVSLKNLSEAQIVISYQNILNTYDIDFIVLAGYLKKIPAAIIKQYPYKIINIHPALLPKYGGEGMYGKHVHAAVVAAGEKQSGITIHYVDEVYDHGEIVLQATCDLAPNETAETLAKKVLALEHLYYTNAIANIIVSQNAVK
jgi:phosphoribosylglycinamide formyltransferase 1